MFAAADSPPRLVTLVLLTAVSVLSLNMFLPSLANIAEDLQADYALIGLSVSGYLAITAALQIGLGPLSDRFGRRPVLLWCIAIFAGASIVCAVAQDVSVFLGFRILQGAIIAGAALSAAVIRDTSDEQESASLMGYVSMAMAVAPMLGPILGGALDGFFGWRANFVVYAVLGLALLWLVWADLGETNPAPADTFGAQMRAYPELLKSRRFWGYSLCMAFGIGAFYIFIAGAPLVAAEVFGISAASLGLSIGSITMGFFIGSFLSGRYAKRMGTIWMILAGRIVAFGGLAVGLTLYGAGVFNAVVFFGATICVGFGNGLTVPSARAGALSIRPRLAGSASGLSGALTVAVGAVLTTVPALVLTAENGAWLLLLLMFGSAAAGLATAVYVWHVDRRESRTA